jgi:hypothetical protein
VSLQWWFQIKQLKQLIYKIVHVCFCMRGLFLFRFYILDSTTHMFSSLIWFCPLNSSSKENRCMRTEHVYFCESRMGKLMSKLWKFRSWKNNAHLKIWISEPYQTFLHRMYRFYAYVFSYDSKFTEISSSVLPCIAMPSFLEFLHN